MKKQFCSLALAAIFSIGSAMAVPQDQDGAAPPPESGHGQGRRLDPNRQLKMMTKRLNLTADQQQQILPILTDRQQQFEKLRSDSSLAPTDRRDKMRSLREDSEAKIKAVLNDDQKQKYEQMQQQMRDRMQRRQQQSSGGDTAN